MSRAQLLLARLRATSAARLPVRSDCALWRSLQHASAALDTGSAALERRAGGERCSGARSLRGAAADAGQASVGRLPWGGARAALVGPSLSAARLLHSGRRDSGDEPPSEREDAPPEDSQRNTNDAEAMHAVHTAIGCNVAILAAKVGVFTLSGSSSIMAEAIHSVADISNQMLLRYGLVNSSRAPDERSNYGYRRELFVWSLISGVGIFCLGAGVSVVHGVHGLLHPEPLHDVWASLSVIGLSIVIESYSLVVAFRALQTGAAAKGISVRSFVADGMDPTSVSVVAEDGGAVLGLALAGGCLLAAGGSGNPAFDSVGSIAVGSLLGVIAGWLIQTNRRALVGRSLRPSQLAALMAALRSDPVVADVLDAKSEEIGPGVFRFKAEVEFNGDTVVSRYLEQPHVREDMTALFAAANTTADGRALDAALAVYGRGVVHAVGAEVDRLEGIIMTVEPSVAHVDIETN